MNDGMPGRHPRYVLYSLITLGQERREPMRIIDLCAPGVSDALVEQVAEILLAAFAGNPSAWSAWDAAVEEVRESLGSDRLSRVALDVDGAPVGWIGGISGYGGVTWELHPLAVSPGVQRQGVGRALVLDLEARVRELGGRNLWLTTDDATGRTSLFGADLYPDVLGRLATLRDTSGHPVGFYQRLGFVVTGVIPDAYGLGRHDIVMAKRIS